MRQFTHERVLAFIDYSLSETYRDLLMLERAGLSAELASRD